MRDLLPRLRVDLSAAPPSDARTLFSPNVEGVWLEIGFGGAEHLLWQAKANGRIGLIGAEPFEDGVVKALSGVEAANLGNVRLHADDARPLLAWLAPASIDRAFVLFPDPWPKARHAKRRLVNTALLRALARVLRPGGELRLATDIASYAQEMLLAIRANGDFEWLAAGPSDWRLRPDDWPATRYEQKALREGRAPVYLRFQRQVR